MLLSNMERKLERYLLIWLSAFKLWYSQRTSFKIQIASRLFNLFQKLLYLGLFNMHFSFQLYLLLFIFPFRNIIEIMYSFVKELPASSSIQMEDMVFREKLPAFFFYLTFFRLSAIILFCSIRKG